MLNNDQFCATQNLQTSPIPLTSFLVWTFFAVSYSKTALVATPILGGNFLGVDLQTFQISLPIYLHLIFDIL